jgi:hypothetical protein
MQRKQPLEKKGGAGMDALPRKKHFDTSGKSPAHFHHRANCGHAHGLAHRTLRVIAS